MVLHSCVVSAWRKTEYYWNGILKKKMIKLKAYLKYFSLLCIIYKKGYVQEPTLINTDWRTWNACIFRTLTPTRKLKGQNIFENYAHARKKKVTKLKLSSVTSKSFLLSWPCPWKKGVATNAICKVKKDNYHRSWDLWAQWITFFHRSTKQMIKWTNLCQQAEEQQNREFETVSQNWKLEVEALWNHM